MNIQSLAVKMSKPNKKLAQQMVASLYKDAHEEDQKVLASLYNYFMPAMPKIAKTDLEWAFKARETGKDARLYLEFSHSDGENLVGTDGHRVHISPTNLAKGYYDGQGNAIDFDKTYQRDFPDYKRTIPRTNMVQTFDTDYLELSNRDIPTYIFPLKDLTLYLNRRYVEEALNGVKEFDLHYGAGQEAPSRVLIRTKSANYAVVMVVDPKYANGER